MNKQTYIFTVKWLMGSIALMITGKIVDSEAAFVIGVISALLATVILFQANI